MQLPPLLTLPLLPPFPTSPPAGAGFTTRPGPSPSFMIPKNTLPLPAGTGSYLQLLLKALRHRGQLAALETSEAGVHLAGTMLAAIGAFCLMLLTGFTLTFAIAAAVWHLEARGWILGGLALVYLAAAALLAFRIHRRMSAWRPLASTRRQLGEDCDLLSEIIPDQSS